MKKEGNKVRLLYFLVFSCTASWLPIFADFLKEQGLSGFQMGMLLSATPFAMLLVQPWYGMLADRIGVKQCLVISSLGASLSFLLFLIHGEFYFLLLATIIMSVFYNALQPLMDSVSLEIAQKDAAFSYSTLRIAGAAGWAVTGIVLGYFITSLSTQVIFIYSSASLLLAFLISLSLINSYRVVSSTSVKQVPALLVLRNKDLLILLFSIFLVSIGVTAIWNFYSIYMKENGASATLVGYGLSFQGLCELPMFYFSAYIITRLGLKQAFLITVFASMLRLFLYSWIKDPVWVIAVELLQGVSWSLFWVVCVESVNRMVPEQARATGQSLLYAAYFGAGQIAGNFWTGFLYDEGMKVSEIFFLNGWIVAGVGIFVMLFLKLKNAEAIR
jgi:PPP family 3-phenylpropionic acid transporter